MKEMEEVREELTSISMPLPWRVSGRHKYPLPLATRSLCPECLSVISAEIDDEDGMVYMDKRCPQHGSYHELISTDTEFFTLMLERDRAQLRGVTNPLEGTQASCPNGCGICSEHLSPPAMMNIDLTNRCNLNCPICFANAKSRGEVVELSMDQVRKMLDIACSVSVVQPACFQYVGGEPTIHPNFLEALREAKKRDFTQIQVASNGIKFAQDPTFAAQASEAGLNIVYLQFDGIDDQVYQQMRGRPLTGLKLRAIENLHQAGIGTILVPTIVKGINDQQIGEITHFAIDNIDKIAGISWQPVAFTGRIDYDQRLAQRFTLADLAREIERQTGLADMYRDWHPLCVVDPFSRLVEAIEGTTQTTISCSPVCGIATFLIVDSRRGKVLPIPSFADVVPLMDKLATAAEHLEKQRIFRRLSSAQKLRSLRQFYHEDRAPVGWTFETFVDFMMDFVDFKQRNKDNQARQKSRIGKSYNVLLMVSMHFQDVYNYQLDRVRRCVVHYVAPDGRIYPFCSYNSGPCHRNRVEKQHAIPLDGYRANPAKSKLSR